MITTLLEAETSAACMLFPANLHIAVGPPRKTDLIVLSAIAMNITLQAVAKHVADVCKIQSVHSHYLRSFTTDWQSVSKKKFGTILGLTVLTGTHHEQQVCLWFGKAQAE